MAASQLATEIWSLEELLNAVGDSVLSEALQCFACDRDDDVTEFLQQHALEYERDGLCRTYLALDSDALFGGDVVIVAFFALAMSSTCIEDSEDGRRDGEETPAFLIAHLARCDRFSHQEYDGATLLREAEELVFKASDIVGGQLIYLDCKVDVTTGQSKLLDYYEDHGYKELSRSSGSVKLAKRIAR
ncbi:hypothetical protein [Adlercreutzia shanghongiae]|uniref:GNAT family N-acetyltransferase n=1 Tax=Adlercreutzia shanghongiae TaxID=3111773 RepID=A0ABU6J0X1_9ACTN|nr:hypothetical protein [Adlercreutzia sp. R22]MEC4295675.1 hypothetical protein [Adlercreutzia sp. R22]